jgi:citrate synthase
MTDKNANLQLPNTNVELPIYSPTLGADVLDIRKLGNSGFYTFDPGFMSTAACRSTITYIDGDAGVLLHRGYRIEDLSEKAEFSETVYLILNGELPTSAQNKDIQALLKKHADVPAQVFKVLEGFPRDAHPMSMLMALVATLDAYYGKDMNWDDAGNRKTMAIQMIAKIPTLAAACHRYMEGKPLLAPKDDLSYAENFLYMMFGEKPTLIVARAMDRIFTLHADHEQNASTSTVRLCGSTGTSPFAAFASGVGALWGPAHGGANEACLEMLREIGSIDRIPHYIARAKDKNDGFRLMGFGHRVYKNKDPRATVMKMSCDEVLAETGNEQAPLFKLAKELEHIALQDPYFIERKLFPNVDFYSGITQTALGIPSKMFTVIFSLARTTGWVAQWCEMMADPEFKIGRPRQLYTGETERAFTELKAR